MTLQATAAVDQVLINHGVFMDKRAGNLGVATLAGPVQATRRHFVFNPGQVMTIPALDVFGTQGVRRTQLKFRRSLRMTPDTILFSGMKI